MVTTIFRKVLNTQHHFLYPYDFELNNSIKKLFKIYKTAVLFFFSFLHTSREPNRIRRRTVLICFVIASLDEMLL